MRPDDGFSFAALRQGQNSDLSLAREFGFHSV
jgi:hypothetical protein